MHSRRQQGSGGPRILAVFAVLVAALSCRAPATQLVVVVDTDLAVPRELGFVRALVRDASGAAVDRRDFVLVDRAVAPGATTFHAPFSFVLVPRDGDAARGVRLEVEAWDRLQGQRLFSRSVVTGFLPGRTLLLPVFLARRCAQGAAPCGAGTTCTEAGCEGEQVPAGRLAEVAPGQELSATRRDATVAPDAPAVTDIVERAPEDAPLDARDAEPEDGPDADAARDALEGDGPDATMDTGPSQDLDGPPMDAHEELLDAGPDARADTLVDAAATDREDLPALLDGGCRTVMDCALPNAVAACREGVCVVESCRAPWANCDLMARNGCEVDTRSATSHCGACGRACGVAGICVDGRCDAVVKLAAGPGHTCALRRARGAGGPVVCWGNNEFGQLGDGTRLARLTPVAVVGLSDAVDVSAGGSHTCAVRRSGQVLCWGLNNANQLGDGRATHTMCTTPGGSSGDCSASPVTVLAPLDAGTSPAAGVSAGTLHTCAWRSLGDALCWGSNVRGSLGDGTTSTRPAPVFVRGLADAMAVVNAGAYHACALRRAGPLACWGWNDNGQLGIGSRMQRNEPTPMLGPDGGGALADVVQVAVATAHSCAVRRGGEALCWGANSSGQLGDGTVGPMLDRTSPVAVVGLGPAAEVAAGGAFSCARLRTGAVSCWGRNAEGQLGDGTRAARLTPGPVRGILDATGITASGGHACVVRATGEVLCWGLNDLGQLGNGSLSARGQVLPMAVTGLP